jgi:PAS domain S-box-containing protein
VASSPHNRTGNRRASALPSILRYGLALLTVGTAVLLMQVLAQVSPDTRPALLVAIAVTALYGGLGPGLLALVLAAIAAPEPVVIMAGAALAGVCGSFRRRGSSARRAQALTDSGKTTPPSPNRFERLEGTSPAGFSPETVRVSPAFTEVTTEATWRFQHEQPLDITLPEDEQVEHLYLYSVLAECNDAFARMYGFRAASDVIGTRLVVFLPPSNTENVAYLRSFIRSGYRLEDAESHEIDRYGNAKYFVNNLVGIFERGQLVGAWGTQRDVTGRKRTESTQEYRSRVHSSKSSLQ